MEAAYPAADGHHSWLVATHAQAGPKSPLEIVRLVSFSGKLEYVVWQNHLRKGFVVRINLNDSQWSEITINTYKYNNIYWNLSKNYYDFCSRINYTEEDWCQNYALKDKSEFAEPISLNSQKILFALKENVIHRHSKLEDPSMESNPHRFELLTDNPRRHRRQEETVHHLHTKDSKSKAWPTTFSKTYPRWPNDS
jgi:hypothetical protein